MSTDPNLESKLLSGTTQFAVVEHQGVQLAVPLGKSILNPDDRQFCFKIKYPKGQPDPYFVNVATKDRDWSLPDCCPGNANAPAADNKQTSSAAAASPTSPSAAANIASPTNNAAAAAGANNNNAADAAGASSDEETIDRVKAYYIKHKPEKIADFATIFNSYRGRYAELLTNVVTRYKFPEPSAEERAQLLANYNAQQQQQGNNTNAAASTTGASSPTAQEDATTNNNAAAVGSPASPSSPSSPGGNLPQAPTAETWTGSYRDRVLNIYAKYAPEAIGKTEKQLVKYSGQEEALIKALVGKYGTEPAPPQKVAASSPTIEIKQQQQDQQQQGQEQEPASPSTPASPPSSPATGATDNQTEALRSLQQNQQENNSNSNLQTQDTFANLQTQDTFANLQTQDTFANIAPLKQQRAPSAEHGVMTEPAALPVPRANVVTVDLPAMPPQAPSRIFDTQQLLTAPASVRQELLMSYVQDRDDRLREALDRNERFSQVIQQLQDGHDNLSREVESTRRRSLQEQETLKQKLRESQHQNESTKQKWIEEKERSKSTAEVAKIQAQRDMNSQLIALEETKITYSKELSDLKSKLNASSHASKAVREEATALLSLLARKEEQMRSQQEDLAKLQEKTVGPQKVSASVQTQESLSDIIRSVAKHMTGVSGMIGAGGNVSTGTSTPLGNNINNNPRSPSADQEAYANISRQILRDATGQQIPLPVVQQGSCKRCGFGAAVLRCDSCRLTLCTRCDAAVHSNNRRFAQHRRQVVAIAPSALQHYQAAGQGQSNPNSSRSTSAAQQQQQQGNSPPRALNMFGASNTNTNSPGSNRTRFGVEQTDATYDLFPEDIDRQLASGLDEDLFERVITQFDQAFSDKREKRHDEVEKMRLRVKELEEAISSARGTSTQSQNNSSSPPANISGGVPPINLSAASRGTTHNSASRRLPESQELLQVRSQIEVEQQRNMELAHRIQELETMLVADPDHRELDTNPNTKNVGGGGGFGSADEKKKLEFTVQQLSKDLDNARSEVKAKRKEITELRSLLSAHMSTPFGVIRSPVAGGTPKK